MCTETGDNSFDAGATEIHYTIEKNEKNLITSVVVEDNGTGMTFSDLDESFSIGDVTRFRKPGQTGKFGKGGTVSCLEHFNVKQTYTVGSEGGHVIHYDMSKVKEDNEWHALAEQYGDLPLSLTLGQKAGTRIVLISPKGTKNFTQNVNNIKKVLGMRYYNRLVKGDKIFVNKELVTPLCPVLSDHPNSEVNKFSLNSDSERNPNPDFDGITITTVDISNVPDKNPGGGSRQSRAGIYVRRNGVLVNTEPYFWNQRGLPPVLKTKIQYDSSGRIIIDHTDKHDLVFGTCVSKDDNYFQQHLADKIAARVGEWSSAIRRSAREKKGTSNPKVRDRLNEELLIASRNSVVSPKRGPGSKPNRGPYKKGEGSVEPLNQKREWLSKIEVKPVYGDNAPLVEYKDGERMVLNSGHQFYAKFIKNASEETYAAVGKILLTLVSVETEALESFIHRDEVPDKPSAEMTVKYLFNKLNEKLMYLD